MAKLKIENLNVYYGVIHALKDVSLAVETGQIVALVGANGAGKTTLLRTISKLVEAKSGEIYLDDKNTAKLSADQLVKLGLGHVPEGRRVFTGLTIEENLLLGAYQIKNPAQIKADLLRIYQRFPILEQRRKQDAATLSGGEQQMLAISRALMGRSKLLLLDEPSMGLAPLLVKEIFRIINEIKAEGTTVLLVEQNARQALSIADYAYVLENGKIALSGTGLALLDNPDVNKLYLGG